jgi:predicted MFS family arabinose efflux permease
MSEPASNAARLEQIDFTGLNRRALSGFLISGMLLSFLGAILPAWRYHVDARFVTIGYYFLFLNVGVLTAARIANAVMPRKGIRFVLITGALVASGSFGYLAAVGPPWPAIWRDIGLAGLGASAGLLNASIFHAISPLYRRDPAATVNLGGILLGLGCVITALMVSGTFYVYNVGSILILFAAVPGLFAIYCARARFGPAAQISEPPIREVLRDFTDPSAILFSLLLFFQFGNEWSIAGWLPIFLVRRIGVSPETALLMLALYWAALLIGRILAQVALARVRHTRLLAGSALAALLGCAALCVTPTAVGSGVAILLVGFGFASIYPIVVERIGHRFTYYHPGFYNGIFSFALSGGLLAPWTLGYFAEAWGIRAVMLVPTLGTCVVVILTLLISIGARSEPAR